MRAAQACVAIFTELKGAGNDLHTAVALGDRAKRPLEELDAECVKIVKTAQALEKEQALALAQLGKRRAKRKR